MSRKLDDSHFAFKCPMKWDDMDASANGRFCHRCSKEVFDLTNCSLDEVRTLQKRHGSLCGFIQAAAVAATLSSAACASRDNGTKCEVSSKSGMWGGGGTVLPLADNTPEARNKVP